jgi:hypothetical protein
MTAVLDRLFIAWRHGKFVEAMSARPMAHELAGCDIVEYRRIVEPAHSAQASGDAYDRAKFEQYAQQMGYKNFELNEFGDYTAWTIGGKWDFWKASRDAITRPAPAEPRFFMDHGLWHDRETGQHLYTSDQYDEGRREAVDLERLKQREAVLFGQPPAEPPKDTDVHRRLLALEDSLIELDADVDAAIESLEADIATYPAEPPKIKAVPASWDEYALQEARRLWNLPEMPKPQLVATLQCALIEAMQFAAPPASEAQP